MSVAFRKVNIPDDMIIQSKFGSEVETEIINTLKSMPTLSLPDKIKTFGNILHSVGMKYHVDEEVNSNKVFYPLDIEGSNKTTYCSRTKDEQLEYLRDYYAAIDTKSGKDSFSFPLEEDNFNYSLDLSISINSTLLKMFVNKKNVKTCDQYGFSPHLLVSAGPKVIIILIRILNNFFTITEDIKNSFEFISKVKISMAMKKKYNNEADPKDFSVMRPRAKFSLCGSIVDKTFADRLKFQFDYKSLWDKSQLTLKEASISVIGICHSIYKNDTKGEFLCFLDLKNAYTSVNREFLFNILEYYFEFGYAMTGKKYYKNFMKYSTAYVDNPDKFIEVNTGIVQGTNASHILFKVYMNRYIELFRQEMKGEKYNIIVYVDDIVVTGVGVRLLKKMLMIFERLNLMFNFKFSKDKIRLLTNDYPQFSETKIKHVELGFRYLGGYIYHDPYLLQDHLIDTLVRDKFDPILKMAKNSMHFLALVKKNIYNVCVHYIPKSFFIYSSNPMLNPIVVMLKELRSLFRDAMTKFDDHLIEETFESVILHLQIIGLQELNSKYSEMNKIFDKYAIETHLNTFTTGTNEILNNTVVKTTTEIKTRSEKLAKIMRKESLKRNIGDSYENFST